MAKLFRVKLHDLRWPPNIPVGLSPWQMMSLANSLRNQGGENVPPILVRRHRKHWHLVDGRHRVMASWMAGRPDVLCQEDPNAHVWCKGELV